MVKTHGLTHIALKVADPDRALRFYRAAFGVEEYFRDAGYDSGQRPRTI